MTKKLFQPHKLGDYTLSHGVVFAATMRKRIDPVTGSPLLPATADYYAQRASPGGLIISECTLIDPLAGSMLGTPGHCPGIFTSTQATAWREVTDAAHAKGGIIFCQLWFQGRVADKRFVDRVYSAGTLPVGQGTHDDGRETPGEADLVPMTRAHMDFFLGRYRDACRLAVGEAGFDGVELHGANGYLLDQFVQSTANNRDDEYGGDGIQDRIRFPLEVLRACCEELGPGRVGIKISPFGRYNNMRSPDLDPLGDVFVPYVTAMADACPGLAFIEAMGPTVAGDDDVPPEEVEAGDDLAPLARVVREKGVAFIANGGFDGVTGLEYAEETGDLVSYSRWFTSNPDLPRRIEKGHPLTPYDRNTLYAATEEGYTTFKSYEES